MAGLGAAVSYRPCDGSWTDEHESEGTTVVLGIPIPSIDPVFLAIVGVHVLFGIAAVIAGASRDAEQEGAWPALEIGNDLLLVPVRRVRHDERSVVHALGGERTTCSSWERFLSPPHTSGARAARRRWRQWPRLHLTGMGASYIVMLTAFYVDNGKNLPLWKELPQIAFWLLPGAIGIPLIVYALFRHRLVRDLRSDASANYAVGKFGLRPRAPLPVRRSVLSGPCPTTTGQCWRVLKQEQNGSKRSGMPFPIGSHLAAAWRCRPPRHRHQAGR